MTPSAAIAAAPATEFPEPVAEAPLLSSPAVVTPPRRSTSPGPPPGAPRRRRPRSRRWTASAAAGATLLAVLAGLRPAAPSAADSPWAASSFPGLGGGRVWSLAIDPANPAVVLAGTDAGVYRSVDLGATWQTTSLRGTRAWTVGFAPGPPNAAFAGLSGRGVQRSDDGGVSWADASAGLGNPNVRVLALGLGGLAAGTSNGIAVSADGKQWHLGGLHGYDVSALALSANEPQFTLVAGADGGNLNQGFLFRNSGAGASWEVLQQGLPSSAIVSAVSAGPLPQGGPVRPLVATTTKGTFRSGDGGSTWTASTGLPSEQVTLTTAAFSPADPNLLYGGSDAGGSTGGALFRSTDGGATFAPADQGLPDARRNVTSIAVSVAGGRPPAVLVGVNPPGKGGAVYRELDASAPAPPALGAEKAVATPVPATPTPVPTPVARPSTTAPSASSPLALRALRYLLRWPFPLAPELLLVVVVAYILLRWRQRYLDIEGPP